MERGGVTASERLRSLPKLAQPVSSEEVFEPKESDSKHHTLPFCPTRCPVGARGLEKNCFFSHLSHSQGSRWAPNLKADHQESVWYPSHLTSPFDLWSLRSPTDKITITTPAQRLGPQELGQRGWSSPTPGTRPVSAPVLWGMPEQLTSQKTQQENNYQTVEEETSLYPGGGAGAGPGKVWGLGRRGREETRGTGRGGTARSRMQEGSEQSGVLRSSESDVGKIYILAMPLAS